MTKLNWQTASDKEKIEWLIRYVLKLPIALLKGQDCAYLAYNEHAPENKEFWRIIVNGYDRVFNPLYSIEDAMLLVEAMRKREGFMNFRLILTMRDRGWYASFSFPGKAKGAFAEAPAMAICKASLQALGLLEA